MTRHHLALTLLIPIALAACEAPAGPTHADGPRFSRQPVQAASGSGHLTSGGDWRTFSFTAQLRADGSVTGHYQLNNRALDSHPKGTVSCLVVIGNEAYVAGYTDDDPNFGHVFRVRDNGQGAGNPPDEITLAGLGTREVVEAACATRSWAAPLEPIEAGNIQVRN